MAGIDTGANGARQTNHDVPLIPFIDFLLCLVMFLLVTAVWNQSARIEADANVPGLSEGETPEKKEKEKEKVLHVSDLGERGFQLRWKQASVVLNSLDVKRAPVLVDGELTYPELSSAIAREWRSNGSYRGPDERRIDRAVLHTENSVEFAHVLAALDSLKTPEREYRDAGGQVVRIPAFQVTFAAK